MYWWILAQAGSRAVLRGPFEDAKTANQRGFELGMYFEILQLPTRNEAMAKKMIKEKRLSKGMTLDKALEPIRHDSLD